jgi:hypothetical protein
MSRTTQSREAATVILRCSPSSARLEGCGYKGVQFILRGRRKGDGTCGDNVPARYTGMTLSLLWQPFLPRGGSGRPPRQGRPDLPGRPLQSRRTPLQSGLRR